MQNVIITDRIPVSAACVDLARYDHLAGLKICLPTDGRVQLLIGQDNAEALLPLEVSRGEKGEPFAVRTIFGWSVNGPAGQGNLHTKTSHFVSRFEPSTPDLIDPGLDKQPDNMHSVEVQTTFDKGYPGVVHQSVDWQGLFFAFLCFTFSFLLVSVRLQCEDACALVPHKYHL